MSTLREKRDKRANVWSQMQEVRDAVDKDGWSDELRQKWDRADAELTELTADIDRDEKAETLGKRFNEIDEETADKRSGAGSPAGGDGADLEDQYRKAFEGWVRYGMTDLDLDQRALLQKRSVDLRAQGVASGAAGGFTVPEGFWAKVTETMKFYATVAGVADVLSTGMGNKIPWPTNDDTSNEGALLDENTQIGEQDLTFGQAELDAFMYTSKLVRVSLQLLQDSGVDIEARVAMALGRRLGRITNRHFTVGTGSAQPQGYVTGATQGVTADVSDLDMDPEVAWLKVVDLVHSVDVAYRGNARFALHDLVLASVRKWRDLDGRPLWIPSIAAGIPDTILNYPYFVNNFQDPGLTAGEKPFVFGNFTDGFVIRNVSGGTLMRLAERYADFLQVGFFGFSRHDSVVQDPSAIKYLEMVA